MNFSSTNFPRSYHAPRDTVTRSRQAVTTVITFLPSFRFVFLSHNQVTILIAFAFPNSGYSALSPVRFIRGGGRGGREKGCCHYPISPSSPFPPFRSALQSPENPILLSLSSGRSYPRGYPPVLASEGRFKFVRPALSLPLLSSRRVSLIHSASYATDIFSLHLDVLCFFIGTIASQRGASSVGEAAAEGNLLERISNGTRRRANFRSVNRRIARRRRPSLSPVKKKISSEMEDAEHRSRRRG